MKIFPAVLVVNKPVDDPAELDTLCTLFETFEHALQIGWMDPYDAPEETKKWFGFNWKTAEKKTEVSLFVGKKGHKTYEGRLSDADAITNFVVESLTAVGR